MLDNNGLSSPGSFREFVRTGGDLLKELRSDESQKKKKNQPRYHKKALKRMRRGMPRL